jgi:hypothetical protein
MGVSEYVVGEVQFNSDTQQQTLPTVTVTNAYPSMSTITMIAPSPDWFSGFYDFSPISADNLWYSSFVIETYPWQVE